MTQRKFSTVFFEMWDRFPGASRAPFDQVHAALSSALRAPFIADFASFASIEDIELAFLDGPQRALCSCYRAVMRKYAKRLARKLGLVCPDPRAAR